MPKKEARKRVAPTNEYESDGGFVDDAPKSKKSKNATASSKPAGASEMHNDEGGNEYWEISRTRRIQISEFKGNTMIAIREFYEKDGKMLPGKKGISLSLDQYNAVVQVLPDIEGVLQSKGIDVSRPEYTGAPRPAMPSTDADVAEDADDSGPSDHAVSGRLDKSNSANRPNHEATSDEEDD